MTGYQDQPFEALLGTEFGGVGAENKYNTIQPKPAEALTTAEKLRLGYTTGDETDFRSLEDRRQMLGLRPANGRHPEWLIHVSPQNRPELLSESQIQGYGGDE